MWIILGSVGGLIVAAAAAIAPLFLFLRGGEFLVNHLGVVRPLRLVLIPLKNLGRNRIRTAFTYLATFVLVAVVTLVWSALYVLDTFMAAKASDIKLIVSERWQAVSKLPWSYVRPLSDGAAQSASDVRPQDSMSWQFYLGTIDPKKQDRDSMVVFIALDPDKAYLMDKVFDDVPQQSGQMAGQKLSQSKDFLAAVLEMKKDPRRVIMGPHLLQQLNKKVGERLTVTGLSTYADLNLEVEIVGTFPEGRYTDSAIMRADYLNQTIDMYPKTHGGQKHARANKSLSLMILQVPDMAACQRVIHQIESSTMFRDPAVKCETLSAFAATQLESYRDIIWFMRWVLAPAVLINIGVIMANSISISMRERRGEIAVLKVLGYRPVQIFVLLLGEAALLGGLAGLVSSVAIYEGVNRLLNTANTVLPIYIPASALWWGPVVGIVTALAGSVSSVSNAVRLHTAAVFARVT
jgi:putative ABC transport system permease protein